MVIFVWKSLIGAFLLVYHVNIMEHKESSRSKEEMYVCKYNYVISLVKWPTAAWLTVLIKLCNFSCVVTKTPFITEHQFVLFSFSFGEPSTTMIISIFKGDPTVTQDSAGKSSRARFKRGSVSYQAENASTMEVGGESIKCAYMHPRKTHFWVSQMT